MLRMVMGAPATSLVLPRTETARLTAGARMTKYLKATKHADAATTKTAIKRLRTHMEAITLCVRRAGPLTRE
jgi:hypothetical protein